MATSNVHRSQGGEHELFDVGPDSPHEPHDRLLAALAPEPVWSRRIRVLLAAGVLALSAGVTATSVAAEPDNQEEGSAVPEPGAVPPGGEAGGSPSVGDDTGQSPGPESGQDTDLPFEVDPVLSGPGGNASGDQAEDAAPVGVTPLEDPDAPSVPSDPATPQESNMGEIGHGDPADPPVPPAEAVPPAEETPPAPTPLGSPTPPAPTADDDPASERSPAARHRTRQRERRAARQRERAQTQVPPSSPPAAFIPAAAQPDAAPASSQPTRAPALRLGNRRSYIVQPGDSLWEIASAVLGTNASPAAIAKEVRRIWRLNKTRIGTGDPNLVPAGVRLRLR